MQKRTDSPIQRGQGCATSLILYSSYDVKTQRYIFVNILVNFFLQHTKFNLAPRGYGRSSYRLAEIIQVLEVIFDYYSNGVF